MTVNNHLTLRICSDHPLPICLFIAEKEARFQKVLFELCGNQVSHTKQDTEAECLKFIKVP